MPQTWDYDKLGRTTYKAMIGYDNGAYPWVAHPALPDGREFSSKGLAKAWVAGWLRRLVPPRTGPVEGVRPSFFGTIERGTYQDTSFEDQDDGFVCDASWEPDEPGYTAYACLRASDGARREVIWDEDDQ